MRSRALRGRLPLIAVVVVVAAAAYAVRFSVLLQTGPLLGSGSGS